MQLFDSHCHLDFSELADDLKGVIARARAAGVRKLMTVGTDCASSGAAAALAGSHGEVYAAVGLHPHAAKHCDPQTIASLQRLAQAPRVQAWGEIGLDFNRMYSPRRDQERWFIAQLEAAAALGLPHIFHERDSGGRLLEILQDHFQRDCGGVVHCFSGSRQELESYLELGLHIGVTGIVTLAKRGRALRRLVPLIPAQRLLIETDAPFLTPAPEKNHQRHNEPAFVRSVLIRLAEVRGEEPETLSRTIWGNTCRLFKITN
jgi:TatD DNase family protein